MKQNSKLLQADVDLWMQGCWGQSPLGVAAETGQVCQDVGRGQLAAPGHLHVQGLAALRLAQLWVVHLLRDSK